MNKFIKINFLLFSLFFFINIGVSANININNTSGSKQMYNNIIEKN